MTRNWGAFQDASLKERLKKALVLKTLKMKPWVY